MATRLIKPGDRVYFQPMRGKEIEAVVYEFKDNDLVLIHYSAGQKVIRQVVKLKDLRLHKGDPPC